MRTAGSEGFLNVELIYYFPKSVADGFLIVLFWCLGLLKPSQNHLGQGMALDGFLDFPVNWSWNWNWSFSS